MLPNLFRLRVLVVDDNVDAADTLADVLRLIGPEVRVCYDGPRALDLAGLFEFDAAVLDIHMPAMGGLELARRLRAAVAPRRVLLVALTGVSTEDARARTREAGFDLHLTKASPLDPLFAALAGLAGW